MSDTREDGFLDGRLRLAQPVRGYRSGADAVMLAAACPAEAGQSVLELGCGAGIASLCLGWRVPNLALTGLERQGVYAELARQNAARNGIAMRVVVGDLMRMPSGLRTESFDHVIANPPYFLGGTAAAEPGRAEARHEDAPLRAWIDAGLRRLRPGGRITLIQRSDRLAGLVAALDQRAGGLTILPIAARRGREAGRVLVVARKGARAPLRLLAPFVMHQSDRHSADREDLTPAAQAVLREGAPIAELFAKVP
ncbi:MAG: tRNA1(Val) (adenine(37)-N6)-methyltransferase [Paracoccus sp. (in: a-proteobacteria)]|jgi:tRNA1(Val) A37 N6-methylase TrmN6|uniref:tRNA1(Val) (adenine(37)-N6)-methyltransferase n=1 Tax=unclassified Paracoccus (in: a-proteobacteria) TaxID=2688777 RepID=UPI000C3CE6E3|nr:MULTISPECIES: methyltransferase [unclassified Paracoccus (in: a-proteobacteria)]MAN57612.1 methyltransferase [Paracoccus sp. (in: a-proteobacteria)]MBA49091.1 methyltransferase [Paracoccus sp. (in: a-proteobacteria)]MDB2551809.1 methyltransferase [Paracoccus sp. (in: a-proteobacteria)]HIC67108.1 methyltransferase domain-containing protein [Paracoccus sp. (in: a-proteobacteria)]|tara:strand:- start:8803 stop:9561 length:759 start_codon:yes stop_codon:yes gene_type:complete